MCADKTAADIDALGDIAALELDNSLGGDARLAYVLETLKNPLCFRFGGMGISLAFDDSAPSLTEVLASLLIRKKIDL